MHDALPLLAKGSKVLVLMVETARGGEIEPLPTPRTSPNTLPATNWTSPLPGPSSPTGCHRRMRCSDYAADMQADLLVVGGYGHSRTREMILGGVTRDLLHHMTLPVLMSH